MKERLLQLLKTDAYRKGEFTLSSGATSEHYVNCKPVTLNGYGLKLACYLFMDHLDTSAKAVGGLTLGADPLVSGVAMLSEMNGLIIRKEPKGHGTGAWIEGPDIPEGSKVTVLEDVVTTGGSSVGAVKKLRDNGFVVDSIVTIIDRQELGSHAIIEQAGIKLTSIFTLNDLLL